MQAIKYDRDKLRKLAEQGLSDLKISLQMDIDNPSNISHWLKKEGLNQIRNEAAAKNRANRNAAAKVIAPPVQQCPKLKCLTCRFRETDKGLGLCQYILIKKERRGCSAENCTRYELDKSTKPKRQRAMRVVI